MAKEVKINHISKIEGHAKLHVVVDGNKIKKVKLKIFEGSRYFEGLLLGKNYSEVPYVTSRICGICSPAHSLCSTQAVEKALGIKVSEQTKLLRDVLMYGGHIQSHVMHLYFLALPDFLGIDSMLHAIKSHKTEVERALRLKRLGNLMVNAIGGRDVHPFNSAIGGLTKLPTQKQINNLVSELKKHRKDFVDTIELFAKMKNPQFEHKTKYYATENLQLTHGKIRNKEKKEIKLHEKYRQFFMPESRAEYVDLNREGYMVGALARINQSPELINKKYQKYFPSQNPFMNNLAQAVEMLYFADKSIEMLSGLKIANEKVKTGKIKEGSFMSTVEAPRGILFHKYSFDKNGKCTHADIVTPTSQNLKQIEDDIKDMLPLILNKSEKEITLTIEKLIRAYDPCISCATHFLKLDIEQIK